MKRQESITGILDKLEEMDAKAEGRHKDFKKYSLYIAIGIGVAGIMCLVGGILTVVG